MTKALVAMLAVAFLAGTAFALPVERVAPENVNTPAVEAAGAKTVPVGRVSSRAVEFAAACDLRPARPPATRPQEYLLRQR